MLRYIRISKAFSFFETIYDIFSYSIDGTAKKISIAKIPGIKMSNTSEAIHGSTIGKIKSSAFSKKKPLQNMMTKFFKIAKTPIITSHQEAVGYLI